MKCSILILIFCVTATNCLVAADQWGDLTGTFLYDGAPPNPARITVTKDPEFCGKFGLVDESLVVGKEGGIKNIAVFMYLSRGAAAPSIHPDYAGKAKDKVRLDNKDCRFEPRVALLRTSQSLLVGNPDAVGHNTKIDCFLNSSVNPLVPAGGTFEQQFPVEERLPVTVSCNIHPWMSARIVVRNNPYMAVTDENGKFTIKNVPAGKWTFQFWHEKAGYVQNVVVGMKETKWSRGRVELDIPTDLGMVKLAPSVFEK